MESRKGPDSEVEISNNEIPETIVLVFIKIITEDGEYTKAKLPLISQAVSLPS